MFSKHSWIPKNPGFGSRKGSCVGNGSKISENPGGVLQTQTLDIFSSQEPSQEPQEC